MDNVLTLDVPADHIMTLSTKKGQTKGMYNPPQSKSFPIPYHDDFECKKSIFNMNINNIKYFNINIETFFVIAYDEFSEANYFSDQSGIFEIRKSQYIQGKVMTQVHTYCSIDVSIIIL